MPAYVIFNRKTGEIVQTHHHPDDLPVSREWLLAITDSEHNRDDLDVSIVDPTLVEQGRAHRVDAGKLHVADKGQVKGFGIAGTSRGPGTGAHRAAKTVFERHPSGSRRT